MRTGNNRYLFYITTILLMFLICSCSGKQKRLSEIPKAEFSNSYEDVWNALEELVIKDLYCVPKKIDKKNGILETEWVYRFDTEGDMRWMIVGKVKKTGDGVVVIMDKIKERPDTSMERRRRYDRQDAAPEDPSRRAGWKIQEIPLVEIRGLYDSLSRKLSN